MLVYAVAEAVPVAARAWVGHGCCRKLEEARSSTREDVSSMSFIRHDGRFFALSFCAAIVVVNGSYAMAGELRSTRVFGPEIRPGRTSTPPA